MNTETPRVFIAATQQNDGKTTIALGLFAALQKRFGRIGFIKPVGQRFIEVEGKQIDEDTVLIDHTFRVHTPLEAMSPIAIEPSFTRKYIEHANADFLTRRIQHSFDRAAWEKDFIIIEGTGHAGVGSVFDLSNARVAHLLGSKVILVTKGGIGRPIDEIALNKALFDREGVEILGVILNKVAPEKYEMVRDFAGRGLARLGIHLLGVIPAEPALATPTLDQIAEVVGGEFINAPGEGRRPVKRVIIGAMSSTHVMEHFQPGTLVITPGDREDVMLAALSTCSLTPEDGRSLAGMVLSGDLFPHQSVLDLLKASHLPVIGSPYDSYTVASRVHSMTVKTLPGENQKIGPIRRMIEQHVQIDQLLERLG